MGGCGLLYLRVEANRLAHVVLVVEVPPQVEGRRRVLAGQREALGRLEVALHAVHAHAAEVVRRLLVARQRLVQLACALACTPRHTTAKDGVTGAGTWGVFGGICGVLGCLSTYRSSSPDSRRVGLRGERTVRRPPLGELAVLLSFQTTR